jgi:hypothetical protein
MVVSENPGWAFSPVPIAVPPSGISRSAVINKLPGIQSLETVTNTYEANRNVLTSKQNTVGTTNISTYSYGVNGIGQRTNLGMTGTAFADVRSVDFGYDSLGQVTKADSTIPGLDRSYIRVAVRTPAISDRLVDRIAHHLVRRPAT